MALSALAAGPTNGHADLLQTDPPANAVLLAPPGQLRLTFSERIDPATAVVRLTDASAGAIDALGAMRSEQGDTAVVVALPHLSPGVYTVDFGVISAVDGHATSGSYAFVVDPTGSAPPPTVAETGGSASVNATAVAARWIGLVGLLLATGSLIAWWHAGRRRLLPLASGGPPWILIGAGAAMGAAGMAAYLLLAAEPIHAAMGGHDHGGAGTVLGPAAGFGWTPFAVAMRVAILAALVVALLALVGWRTGHKREAWAPPMAGLAGIAAGAALAGMSGTGHAASLGGPLFAAFDWLHLLAVAAWLGAIPATFLLAHRLQRSGLPGAEARRGMLAAHGRLALVAAPTVALTGIANSPLVLGSGRELVASGYGNLLLAKALLLGVALAMGAVNHLALRRRTRGAATVLIGLELGVAVMAVLLAAALVTSPPAAGRQAARSEPPISAAQLSGTVGSTRVRAAVNLPSPGVQTYQVALTDEQTGRPPSDVDAVVLSFSAPQGSNVSSARVELSQTEVPGLFTSIGAYTPIPGTWGLEVTLRRHGGPDGSVGFPLEVIAPQEPEALPPTDTGAGIPAPVTVLWPLVPQGPAAWLPGVAAAVGLLALPVVGRSWRASTLGAARGALVVVLCLGLVAAGSRALVTAANEVPPHAASRANPTAPTVGSLERGERLYLANCASCHGVTGAGDGPAASLPRPRPLAEALDRLTDGELEYRMATGVAGTPMPGFSTSLSRADRWDLVNYLRHGRP